jgi:hypothetical protein
MKASTKLFIFLVFFTALIAGSLFYKFKFASSSRLQDYKKLLRPPTSTSQFYTYTAGSSFTFMGNDFLISDEGFRSNVILDEEEARNPGFLKQNHYRIAIVGSWIAANANAEAHQSLASQFNLISKNKIGNQSVIFYNYTNGANNLEKMTHLLASVLSQKPFDAVLLFIEAKDLVYNYDRFSTEQTTSVDAIFQESNWSKTLKLLIQLRGEINSKYNVDIIPVIMPVHETEQQKYIPFIEALYHQGFEIIYIDDPVIQEETKTINEFTWPSLEYVQTLTVIVLNYLNIKGLKH